MARKPIIIFVSASVGVVMLFLAYLGVWAVTHPFSGGMQGAFRDLAPRARPEDSTLQARKQDLKLKLGAFLDEALPNDIFSFYAESFVDDCQRGQYNFKVKSDYLDRCFLSIARVYGFDGDFRERMIGLERGIVYQGWQPTQVWRKERFEPADMEYYMLNYYDYRPSSLTVNRVPSPRYEYQNELSLLIDWLEQEPTHSPWVERLSHEGGQGVNSQWKKIDAEIFKETLKKHKYLLILMASGNYFESHMWEFLR